MKKTSPAIFIILIIVVGILSFYGGTKYSAGKTQNGGENFGNLTPEQRQQRFSQMGGNRGQGGQNRGGGMINGEIIAKDDQSITVKLPDGGSKIVFYSAATEIGKFEKGSATDLKNQKTVMIRGTANSDGSITAQSIQLRPDMPIPPAAPTVQGEQPAPNGQK